MVPEAKTSRHPHMVTIHRFSTPNGLRSVTQRLSTVGITQKPSMGGPSQAMAEPADGSQRATHPRHGRGKGPAGIK